MSRSKYSTVQEPPCPSPEQQKDNGFTFVGDQYDNNYLSYVGWDIITQNNPGYRMFFSEENIMMIQSMVRDRLKQAGHDVIVTKRVIAGVMSDIVRKNTPKVGDIYSIFNIPDQQPRSDVLSMNQRVINILVQTILDEYEMKKWNESLNIWDTVYGDFNRKGLRAHSKIRKKDKDILKGQFNINY